MEVLSGIMLGSWSDYELARTWARKKDCLLDYYSAAQWVRA